MCFSRPFNENCYGSFSLVLSRKMVMGLFRPGSRTIVTRVAITDKCCMYSNVGLSSSMISSLPGGIHRPEMEINTPKTACGGVIIQFHIYIKATRAILSSYGMPFHIPDDP